MASSWSIEGRSLGPGRTRYVIIINTWQYRLIRIMLRHVASDYENIWIFECNEARITSGRRRIFQLSDFDVIRVQFRKLCKGSWLFVMLKTKDFRLYLNSVDVDKVEALINYPSHLFRFCLVLKQSPAMSDTNWPDEVQGCINVHFGLNSADSNSVEKFV